MVEECDHNHRSRTPFCGMMVGMIRTACGSSTMNDFQPDLMRPGALNVSKCPGKGAVTWNWGTPPEMAISMGHLAIFIARIHIHWIWGSYTMDSPSSRSCQVSKKAKDYGAGTGVWLSPWGGYGFTQEARVKFGKKKGCLAHHGTPWLYCPTGRSNGVKPCIWVDPIDRFVDTWVGPSRSSGSWIATGNALFFFQHSRALQVMRPTTTEISSPKVSALLGRSTRKPSTTPPCAFAVSKAEGTDAAIRETLEVQLAVLFQADHRYLDLGLSKNMDVVSNINMG